jgi:hypothetical protein
VAEHDRLSPSGASRLAVTAPEWRKVPLDNGIVARLHVRAALTRTNFLLAGSDSVGDRVAIAYSILGSCCIAGVDPLAYLAGVRRRLIGRIRI